MTRPLTKSGRAADLKQNCGRYAPNRNLNFDIFGGKTLTPTSLGVLPQTPGEGRRQKAERRRTGGLTVEGKREAGRRERNEAKPGACVEFQNFLN